MAISKKVIQANRLARQSERVETTVFEVSQGSSVFVTFNGANIFEFDTIQDAQRWKDDLNAALSPALANLKAFYDAKVQAIINA